MLYLKAHDHCYTIKEKKTHMGWKEGKALNKELDFAQ